jgi:hypothetical protein
LEPLGIVVLIEVPPIAEFQGNASGQLRCAQDSGPGRLTVVNSDFGRTDNSGAQPPESSRSLLTTLSSHLMPIRVGFAIWLDNDLNKFNASFGTNSESRAALRKAIEGSDR